MAAGRIEQILMNSTSDRIVLDRHCCRLVYKQTSLARAAFSAGGSGGRWAEQGSMI